MSQAPSNLQIESFLWRTKCREAAHQTSANEMDQSADFERAVEEMEWGDVVFTLQAVFDEILGDTPSPPPPPPMPAGLGFNPHPQPGESLSGEPGGCIPLGAAPHTFEQPLLATPGLNVGQAAPIVYQRPLYDQNVMQSHHLYSQAGAYSQGQVRYLVKLRDRYYENCINICIKKDTYQLELKDLQ